MNPEKWIRDQIAAHMEKHRIMADPRMLEEMTQAGVNGCYAFRIIYLDLGDNYFDWVLNSFELLDHSLVIRGKGDRFPFFSYDGGKRYQWPDTETVYLDPAMVREIKIDRLLQQETKKPNIGESTVE